jgi:hypothetical protein
MSEVPVILFAYARPSCLQRSLESMRQNGVKRIIAYSDGAKGESDREKVAAVRQILRAVDWSELTLIERSANWGLGENVRDGISEVARTFESFIVWEDDLVAVPGTYGWICEALAFYHSNPRVMSVTAWTSSKVVPADTKAAPYFDGRAECWLWGGYARSWKGMSEETALDKMQAAKKRGIRPDAYGSDLVSQAYAEKRKNLWASRWLYHHFEYGGICLRPPWNLVEHIDFDSSATNSIESTLTRYTPSSDATHIERNWPEASEHPDCQILWKRASPSAFALFVLKVKARLFGRRVSK